MNANASAIGELQEKSRELRVALVHDWLNGMRGGERVLEYFCDLFPAADLFTLFYEPEKVSRLIRGMKVHEHPLAQRIPALRRHYRKLLPVMPRMVRDFPTDRYDLVISTSHCVAKGTRPPRRGMNLSYVFSPMRYVWDHFEDYLGRSFAQDTALRLARGRLQSWDRASAQQIDSIAADSRHIAAKIERFWGRKSEVIYPPVNLDFFTPEESPETPRPPIPGLQSVEPDGYFLVVSALVPYKHVERAVEASRLAQQPLVVIGDGPERGRLEAMKHRYVTFRGWTSDQNLREAYRHCKALLYPGMEDFGITALEAQACGRPVLALRQGGATETIVDGSTGAFFDAPTAEALAELLVSFETMSFNPEGIRRHAESFSPARFREETARWILREGNIRCW